MRLYREDFQSSLVVSLVALPLCLGIALASKAPLSSGLIAGILGGIIVGFISKSRVSVSGPAAGLTAIIAAAIIQMGDFATFQTAVVLCGIFQIVLGTLRLGLLGHLFPNSIVKGMLAAIGLILILKQIPHAVGWDFDFEGDLNFMQLDGQNTFSEILGALNNLSINSTLIFGVVLTILLIFEKTGLKKLPLTKIIPASLIAILVGVGFDQILIHADTYTALSPEHYVRLPILNSLSDASLLFSTPNFSALSNPYVWQIAITLALVASLESLLSINAADKLDPDHSITPPNRELVAQGVANLLSGLIGGLPLTAVIVRTSANIQSGARTKASAIMHGVWLLVYIFAIPSLLNFIPLSALAAILILIGYKLASPNLFKSVYKEGWDQFIPFIGTIVVTLLTDLLTGIFAGVFLGLVFVLRANAFSSLIKVSDGNNHLIRLQQKVTFINKMILKRTLEAIPENSCVLIDGTRSIFVDHDIIDTIKEYCDLAAHKNIQVIIKRSPNAGHEFFREVA